MKEYLTELIGTFFLTLTVALSGQSDLAPLAIGATLMVMIYAGGYLSGAHYNPAVSIAVALSRGLSRAKMRGYIIAQLIGSTAALLIADGIAGTALHPMPAGSIIFAPIVLEVLFTMALAYVVLHTGLAKEVKGNQYYGLAIGAVLVFAAIVAGPISGAVLNPAIGIASFLTSFVTKTAPNIPVLLLYTLAPITGAVLAAGVYGIQKGK